MMFTENISEHHQLPLYSLHGIIDKANHSCENALSTIVYHTVKGFLIKCFTFLALLDIKAFGHLSLITMLLMIGLALFYIQAVFV